ncbi:hypothetical protein KP509_25G006000 [Ceratopteris richardii]|uniref:HMA domain-containing protein n=3 Tax=Ceratopteris richardii TaxID=49495 RepID=A0A8T2RQE0_CERRI|nr:hypothetical protein KP509_25G006000 [Ceratopteris richardii]
MSEGSKNDEGRIVLETKMTSEECRYRIYKAIVSYPGVEDVSIDMKGNKVTLKAPNVEPTHLFESIKRKSGGKVTKLLHPTPKEKKLVEVTVVLKMNIDCSKCKKKILKAAWKIKDVSSVRVEEQTVVIRGLNLDPRKVCSDVCKYSGKLAEIVPENKDSHEKEKNNKDDEKKETDAAMEQPAHMDMYASPPYFSDENPNACIVM